MAAPKWPQIFYSRGRIKGLTLKLNSQKDREDTRGVGYGLGVACMQERRTEEGITWRWWSVKGSVRQRRVSAGQMMGRHRVSRVAVKQRGWPRQRGSKYRVGVAVGLLGWGDCGQSLQRARTAVSLCRMAGGQVCGGSTPGRQLGWRREDLVAVGRMQSLRGRIPGREGALQWQQARRGPPATPPQGVVRREERMSGKHAGPAGPQDGPAGVAEIQ